MDEIGEFVKEWCDYETLTRLKMEMDLKQLIRDKINQALWTGSEGMPETKEFVERIKKESEKHLLARVQGQDAIRLIEVIKWQQARIALMATDNGYKDGYEVGYKKGLDIGYDKGVLAHARSSLSNQERDAIDAG